MRHAPMPLLAVACITLALVGCQHREPGVHREGGTYYQWMAATPHQVADAAVRASGGLDLHIISETRTAQPTRVVARNTYGALVTVTAQQEGRSSKVGVKVEPGADESYSRIVLDAIRAAL